MPMLFVLFLVSSFVDGISSSLVGVPRTDECLLPKISVDCRYRNTNACVHPAFRKLRGVRMFFLCKRRAAFCLLLVLIGCAPMVLSQYIFCVLDGIYHTPASRDFTLSPNRETEQIVPPKMGHTRRRGSTTKMALSLLGISSRGVPYSDGEMTSARPGSWDAFGGQNIH